MYIIICSRTLLSKDNAVNSACFGDVGYNNYFETRRVVYNLRALPRSIFQMAYVVTDS